MGSAIPRNEPCPCGSGKKYKQCHLGQELPQQQVERGGLNWRRLIPILLIIIGVIAGTAVAIDGKLTEGIAIAGGTLLGVGCYLSLRSPPPVTGDRSDAAGLNFGR